MLTKLSMITVAIMAHFVQTFDQCIRLSDDLFPESLGRLQVFAYIEDLLAVLVQEGLSICQHLVHFVVDLGDLGDVLVVVVLHDYYDFFLLLV
jgi:hypothetical protein